MTIGRLYQRLSGIDQAEQHTFDAIKLMGFVQYGMGAMTQSLRR